MGQQHSAPWSACGPTDGRDSYANAFRRDGYYLHEGVLSSDEVETLRRAVAEIPQGEEVRRRKSVYGVRNLLKICPAVRQLAADPRIRQFVTPILGDAAFAVRAIFFDKAPGGNWSLFWHQDNVVAVAERHEAPEFVGWSQKAGVWQVQPPAEVLANMVAVRVHLDDSMPLNGPLRVLPGSHRQGWIEDLDEWKQNVREVVCTVGSGGVVIMRPLTLHASAASESTAHRRVIHIEYAAEELPHGLAWSDRIGPNGGEPVALARASARDFLTPLLALRARDRGSLHHLSPAISNGSVVWPILPELWSVIVSCRS